MKFCLQHQLLAAHLGLPLKGIVKVEHYVHFLLFRLFIPRPLGMAPDSKHHPQSEMQLFSQEPLAAEVREGKDQSLGPLSFTDW